MSFAPSSPITGAIVTGLTDPTFTLTADTPPNSNSKQYAITALGGTQTGVESHSVAAPYTLTFERPKVLKVLGNLNPVTGAPSSISRNVYKLRTRKGVIPLSGQPYTTAMITTIAEIPAGSDVADPESLMSMLSCHAGALAGESIGIGNTYVSGVM
jgi:hypothetical protein